jgi:hypothetical protein
MDTGVCITCNAADVELNADEMCEDCAAEEKPAEMGMEMEDENA